MMSVVIKGWNWVTGKHENIRISDHMIRTIEADHARIHDGHAFSFSELYTVADVSSLSFLFQVGSADMHLRAYDFASTHGPCEISLYENPFFDVNSIGNAIVPCNMNRTSSVISTSSCWNMPFLNVSSIGTKLASGLIEQTAGGPIKAAGGTESQAITEWDLKANNNYAFWLTNSGGASAFINANFFWYEHGRD